jgi:hypothetical protein
MKMWKSNRKPLQKIATIETEINIIYIHVCVVWASENCIKFAKLNRTNSSKMLFGLVYENVFGTDC